MISSTRPRLNLLVIAGAMALSGCTDVKDAPDAADVTALPTVSTPIPTAVAAASATAAAAAALPGDWRSFGEAGTQPGQMMLPFDVAADGQGGLYVSDTTGVSRYSVDGTFQARIGEGRIKRAEGVAVGPDGEVFVAGNGSQIEVYGSDGAFRRSLGTVGSSAGELIKPIDLAFDGQGRLFVVDVGNRRVAIFDPSGPHVGNVGGPGEQSGQFTAPRSIALDAAGRLYVGAGDDYLVQRFSPDGSYLDTFGNGNLDETLYRVGGLAAVGSEQIFVSQVTRHTVQAFDISGDARPRLLWEMGGRPGDGMQAFNSRGGITIHSSRVYVADTRNNRVVSFAIDQP